MRKVQYPEELMEVDSELEEGENEVAKTDKVAETNKVAAMRRRIQRQSMMGTIGMMRATPAAHGIQIVYR